MATTYTDNLDLGKPGEGDQSWKTVEDAAKGIVDGCLAGELSKSVAGSSNVNLTTSETNNIKLKLTGALTGNIDVTVPAKKRLFVVENGTTGSFTLTFKVLGGTGVVLEQGEKYLCYSDGTNMENALSILIADGAVTTAKLDTYIGACLKDYSEDVNPIGSIGGGAQTIDLEDGNVVSGTVDTSTTTFTFSNPPASGALGGFTLVLTNGGSRTVNWPASVDWAGGTAPTLTTAGIDTLVFFTIDGGTIWYGAMSIEDGK